MTPNIQVPARGSSLLLPSLSDITQPHSGKSFWTNVCQRGKVSRLTTSTMESPHTFHCPFQQHPATWVFLTAHLSSVSPEMLGVYRQKAASGSKSASQPPTIFCKTREGLSPSPLVISKRKFQHIFVSCAPKYSNHTQLVFNP